MSSKIFACKQCGDSIKGQVSLEHFFYCSVECRTEKEEAQLAARLKEKESHAPWDRMSEPQRETTRRLLNTAGPVVWTPEIVTALAVSGGEERGPLKRKDGKVDGRSKGVRKCGRCGESGHNARTCGRKAGARSMAGSKAPVAASLAHLRPTMASIEEPEAEASSAPVKPEAAKVTKPKGSGRSCGKCGQSGHNARTCGREKGQPMVAAKSSKAPEKASEVKGNKPRKQKTCGKCGQKGHNARTCGRNA